MKTSPIKLKFFANFYNLQGQVLSCTEPTDKKEALCHLVDKINGAPGLDIKASIHTLASASYDAPANARIFG
jgi:hypothetical protein